jgi:purine nucleoside permease
MQREDKHDQDTHWNVNDALESCNDRLWCLEADPSMRAICAHHRITLVPTWHLLTAVAGLDCTRCGHGLAAWCASADAICLSCLLKA